MNSEPNKTLPWDSYPAMVKSLFKQMPGPYGTIMHAAIGIAGETGEILDSTSRNDLLKELGDIEFYIEAMWQHIGGRRNTRVGPVDGAYAFSEYCTYICVTGCQILDLAKKSWVYEKEFFSSKMYNLLTMLEVTLDNFYDTLGTDEVSIKRLNMEKLALRYQAGTYSNEAAISQVDKAITGEGEGANHD